MYYATTIRLRSPEDPGFSSPVKESSTRKHTKRRIQGQLFLEGRFSRLVWGIDVSDIPRDSVQRIKLVNAVSHSEK